MHFHRGFSVITGETGAGKSILLGAIGLLLGQRAETRMIKAGANRCVIEAEFDLDGYAMEAFFNKHDFDFDGHTCLIRRELLASGKSRAFINDTPAQVAQLRELGNQLIDIHSQHQNLLIANEDFQLSVLDILAHNEEQRKAYAEAFAAYQHATSDLQEAEKELARSREEEDYLRFQMQQLDDLHLESGMQEAMEQEVQMLEHAEEIRSALWSAASLMQGEEQRGAGVIAALREAQHHLQSVASLMPAADELTARIDACLIELKDIQSELDTDARRVEINPQRLDVVNAWLSNFYAALKKHHVNDEAALMALADSYRSKLARIDNADDHLLLLRQTQQQAAEALLKLARELSGQRQKAARLVEQQMHERLAPLGIPNVRFSVGITQRTEPSPTGLDQVEFLFSANRNSPLQRVSEVASGGEIARVMLSLKAMMSGEVKLPTVIFDEIDTGVSGQIAERMALMMRQMGDGGRQVISITHLPQIAAIGAHHYRVYKEDAQEGASTHILELDSEERVTELAHMLSGAQLTDAAVQNARALLHNT